MDREKQNAYSRASYRRNRERALEQKRAWRLRNPDYMREYAATHREEKRENRTRSTYGVGRQEYAALLAAQDGHCAMCEATIGTQRNGKTEPLFIDHDKETGRVRGLLCNRCNSAIGYIDHRVEVAEAAVRYLLNPPAWDVLAPTASLWFGRDEAEE